MKKIRWDRVLVVLAFSCLPVMFITLNIRVKNQIKYKEYEITTYAVKHISQPRTMSYKPKNVIKSDIEIVKELSNKYGVDWKLIYAVSIHETGHHTSRAYKELNNVGGLMYWTGSKMALREFKSTYESYEFMIKNIKNNYIDKGLTTIEQIGNKYCPVGINDKGQNSHWIPTVTKIYNSLGGDK